jgi:hypothetical protein
MNASEERHEESPEESKVCLTDPIPRVLAPNMLNDVLCHVVFVTRDQKRGSGTNACASRPSKFAKTQACASDACCGFSCTAASFCASGAELTHGFRVSSFFADNVAGREAKCAY